MVKKSLLFAAVLLGAMGLGAVLAEHRAREHDVVLPAKISKEDISGTIFERPDTVTRTRGGNTIHRSCVICTPPSMAVRLLQRAVRVRASRYSSGWCNVFAFRAL